MSVSYTHLDVYKRQDLNFKSSSSYIDSTRTDFGDINGNAEDGNALITEMTTGTGFMPIGKENYSFFGGYFDGDYHKIQNIYISKTGQAGLFGYVSISNADRLSSIKNLTITGNISGTETVGGIVATITSSARWKCVS